jgi:calcineurin-like phosphoesterase family protein
MKYCPRRSELWVNVKEMNQGLIDNWNSVVSSGDLVYHLGDFAFRKKGDTNAFQKIVDQLNGQIILIKGNHDRTKEVKGIFPIVLETATMKLGSKLYGVAHAPPDAVINGVKYGLCGHVHNKWKIHINRVLHVSKHKTISKKIPLINCGVDVWDYKPVSFEEITNLTQSLGHE